MWRMGFVITHDKITLHSAARGGQEPSRKHCILFFLLGSNPQYPESFLWSHKHWGHVYAERQHKAAKTQSNKSSWYGAVLCHTVLVVWVHSHGFSTELGRTSQLPNSSLASPWLDLRRHFQTWGSSSRANPAQLECTSFTATDNHICFYAEWRKCSPPMLLLMLFFLLWQYQEK